MLKFDINVSDKVQLLTSCKLWDQYYAEHLYHGEAHFEMSWRDERDLCRGRNLNWSSREFGFLYILRMKNIFHVLPGIPSREKWMRNEDFVCSTHWCFSFVTQLLPGCLGINWHQASNQVIVLWVVKHSNNHSFFRVFLLHKDHTKSLLRSTVSQWKFQGGKTWRDFTHLTNMLCFTHFLTSVFPVPLRLFRQLTLEEGRFVNKF